MGRAERRHQEEVKKDKIRHVIKNVWRRPGLIDSCRLGMLAHTPQLCSCPMCGNPRKYVKGKDSRTLQERRESEKGIDL